MKHFCDHWQMGALGPLRYKALNVIFINQINYFQNGNLSGGPSEQTACLLEVDYR
jgi:hypothetical protein